jgi:hypothetical protein
VGKPWGFMNARKENSEWRALCIGFLLGDLVGIAFVHRCATATYSKGLFWDLWPVGGILPRNDGAVGDGGHRSMYRDEAKLFLCLDCVGFSPTARSSWRYRGSVA